MPSLLEILGGRDAVEVVVVGLCERVWSDLSLRAHFREVDRPRYERHLVEYLCALFGDRAAAWTGRDLGAVHAELAITDAEFDRFVDHLAATLEAAAVSRALIGAVADRVDSIRTRIVTIAGRATPVEDRP